MQTVKVNPSGMYSPTHRAKSVTAKMPTLPATRIAIPERDIALMSELGLNAYRFSIAWSRVLPEGRGQINQKGMDYYSRLVDLLLERHITPFITLFHWDTPQALQDMCGGFAGRDMAFYFADYAELVVKALGDRVRSWITLNEPWEHAAFGHLLGTHAPGAHNPFKYFRVAHHELLGHGLAMERIRSVSPEARVGITLSLTPIYPATPKPKDIAAARVADQFFNDFYLDGFSKARIQIPCGNRSVLPIPGSAPMI